MWLRWLSQHLQHRSFRRSCILSMWSKRDFRVLVFSMLWGHDGRVDRNLVPKYNGVWHASKMIYRTEGLRGLTKGLFVSLFANSFANTCFFVMYSYIVIMTATSTPSKPSNPIPINTSSCPQFTPVHYPQWSHSRYGWLRLGCCSTPIRMSQYDPNSFMTLGLQEHPKCLLRNSQSARIQGFLPGYHDVSCPLYTWYRANELLRTLHAASRARTCETFHQWHAFQSVCYLCDIPPQYHSHAHSIELIYWILEP